MRRIPILVLVVLAACAQDVDRASSSPVGTSPNAEVVFRSAGIEHSLSVRVADSEAERAEGLMGVRDLPADEGMAFVFQEPSTSTFWMQDTLLPLAIAFVGADGHILTITEMTPCTTDPCPTYAADGPYTLAVEANAGWFGANGVTVGDEALLLEGR